MLSIIEPPVFFDSAAELAQMFETNRSLIHVDFSFNDFWEKDCKVIAGGLKRNHHILGAHFTGNEWDCDAQGFLRPDKNVNPSSNQILCKMKPDLETG